MVYQNLAGFEFKDKTTLTGSEIVAYLKSILYENRLFTFGQALQRQGKLISKVHRYLIANLPAYQNSCASTVSKYEETDSLEKARENEILAKTEVLSSWIDI